MSVKERLTEFIRYKEISQSSFCKTIGVSNAFISSMRKSIQPDKIKRIALSYPELNTTWLMTGEGEMLRKVEASEAKTPFHTILDEKDKRIHQLEEMLAKQFDVIEKLSNSVSQLATNTEQTKKKEAI